MTVYRTIMSRWRCGEVGKRETTRRHKDEEAETCNRQLKESLLSSLLRSMTYADNPFLQDDSDYYTYGDDTNEDSLLVESGAAVGVGTFFLEDELAQTHAQEQAAGWSTENNTISASEYQDETDTRDNNEHQPLQPQLAMNVPPPLVNYPVFSGEGDIGGRTTPTNSQRMNNIRKSTPSSPRREPSQTTSMIPPNEYADMIMIGSTRRGRQRENCCTKARPERLRCIGAAVSATGVFVLGFMMVLLGHMWYEKNHNSNGNNSSNDSTDVTTWTVVQVVTPGPEATEPPEAIANRTDENEDTWADDKSTNTTTTDPPKVESWTDDTSLLQVFQLHLSTQPVELHLGAGQAVHVVDMENKNATADSLCTDTTNLLIQAAASVSMTARIRQLAVQVDVEDDTTLAVCQENDEITALLHYILVPTDSESNTTTIQSEVHREGCCCMK